MSLYYIASVGEMYAVFKNGRQVSPAARDRTKAVDRKCALEGIEAKRSQLARQCRCLSCNNPFLSEGPHNRLCRNCRLSGRGLDNQMLGIAHGGGGGKVPAKRSRHGS
jgi:hypothetical protein